jgi:methylated-DNA-[protein]-cysteine S-methyltransferase
MVTAFQEEVYAALRKVPAGKVITYAGLADMVGSKAFRAVGMAMRCNPYAPEVPCHRVVCSNGSLGGFKGKTSGKEINEKIALLASESVLVVDGKIVDFKKRLY